MVIRSIRIQNLKNMTIVFQIIRGKSPKKKIKHTGKIIKSYKSNTFNQVCHDNLIRKIIENSDL